MLAVLLALPLLAVEWGLQHPRYAPKPDLVDLFAHAPAGWRMRQSGTEAVDPRWSPETLATYDLVLARQFARADGQEVTLMITWSREGYRNAGHDQEVCYGGLGFAIDRVSDTQLATALVSLPVKSFAARGAAFVEDVVYWRVTGGVLEQRRDALSRRLGQLRTGPWTDLADNLMVRVSSRRPLKSAPSALNPQFIDDYLRALGPVPLRRVIGGGGAG